MCHWFNSSSSHHLPRRAYAINCVGPFFRLSGYSIPLADSYHCPRSDSNNAEYDAALMFGRPPLHPTPPAGVNAAPVWKLARQVPPGAARARNPGCRRQARSHASRFRGMMTTDTVQCSGNREGREDSRGHESETNPPHIGPVTLWGHCHGHRTD